MLEHIITSKARTQIFILLFQEEKEFYLRQMQRETDLTINAIKTEITNLLKLDLIIKRIDGNRTYYKANTNHPIYPEIKSIVEKTEGIQQIIKESLKDLPIKIAFIFGSIAKGSAKSHSDIDLLIIGQTSLRKLSSKLTPLQEKLGREINPHIYTVADFQKQLKTKNHFVNAIQKTQKKYIIGSDEQFRKICTNRLN
ncbi:MAG: nucleotidyltransferase domain-containing protein [Bacteriovoracia bacterium]